MPNRKVFQAVTAVFLVTMRCCGGWRIAIVVIGELLPHNLQLAESLAD